MHVLVGLMLVVLAAGCSNEPESKIPYSALPAEGDPVRGERLYNELASPLPPCSSCHNEEANASPLLERYSEIAGSRVEGQNAHEYTFYSIVEPWRHVVDGYGNAMYNEYDDRLQPQDIADLIAYVLSL